ncbi:MAG: DNA-binding protein [Gammaproteobacteria bacterium]
MSAYDFTLKFAIPHGLDRQELEDRLFGGGCDDALLGTGQKGRMALSFTREAGSAKEAIDSAIHDVRNAVPEATLVEVAPDRVGISDMADLFQFSRQNMRKLVQTHLDSFPLPLHEGRSSLWHLADVLDWFAGRQGREVDPVLLEVARESMRINIDREFRRLPDNMVVNVE